LNKNAIEEDEKPGLKWRSSFTLLGENGTNRRESLEHMKTREPKKILKIYTIVEKPGSKRRIWLDIGVASYNRDGSISAKLDALPVTGVIHIREFEPRRVDAFRRDGDQDHRQKEDKSVRLEGLKTPHEEWQ
jgi:hypothetical protein